MTGADPRTTGTLGNPIDDADGFYFETVATSVGGGALTLGIVNDERHNECMDEQIHSRSGSYMWRPYSSGQFFVETSTNTSYGDYTDGDVLGWFVKNSKLYVRKNNSDVVGDVVNVSGGIDISGDLFFPAVSRTVGGGTQTTAILRPDSDSWSYTPPSGFKGLTSKDMFISSDIDPAGDDGETENPQKQFNVVTYTGNGSTINVTGAGFQPDFVWIKGRSVGYDNMMFDTNRGTNKIIKSNSDAAEITTVSTALTSFDSDGFTYGSEASGNQSSATYVAWMWKCNGGTTVTNNDGSMTSTVQANTKAGFSIVTYTGDGSDGTVGHGLDKAPELVMSKRRDGTGSWYTLHSSLGTGYFELNGTGTYQSGSVPFSSSLPTENVVGATSANRISSQTFIYYCWHSVDGYSRFGLFQGNGDTDGPFVYTGFRPRLVFCKNSAASENWQVRDTARSTFNASSQVRIYWNATSAEGSASTASPIEFLSNGFKVIGSNSEINGNGQQIAFGAWGDVPFKYNNTF